MPTPGGASDRTSLSPRLIAATVALAIAGNIMALAIYRPVARLLLIERPLQNLEDERNVRWALALRDASSENAVVAVTWAGAIPYFSERTAVDLLGKSDVKIAHEPMHIPPGFWQRIIPGHAKWDYQYSIRELKPDAIQAPLFRTTYELDTPDAYLADYELRQVGKDAVYYVRRDTRNVRSVPLSTEQR
jgi:hypothetical protein